MTEDQIKYMVDRFLGWPLPETFNPDGGITFEKVGNKGTPHEYKRRPSGTNVLDAAQATAMVRHMIEGMPEACQRQPGIDPKTGEYSTAQMMADEMTMGDTTKPLMD